VLAAPGLLQVFLPLTLVCRKRFGLQEIRLVVLCWTSVEKRERDKKTRLWKGPFVSSGKEIRLSVNISCNLLLEKPYFSLPFDT